MDLVVSPKRGWSVSEFSISRLINTIPTDKCQKSQEEIDIPSELNYHFLRYRLSYFATQNLLM